MNIDGLAEDGIEVPQLTLLFFFHGGSHQRLFDGERSSVGGFPGNGDRFASTKEIRTKGEFSVPYQPFETTRFRADFDGPLKTHQFAVFALEGDDVDLLRYFRIAAAEACSAVGG